MEDLKDMIFPFLVYSSQGKIPDTRKNKVLSAQQERLLFVSLPWELQAESKAFCCTKEAALLCMYVKPVNMSRLFTGFTINKLEILLIYGIARQSKQHRIRALFSFVDPVNRTHFKRSDPGYRPHTAGIECCMVFGCWIA
jgi:hypothetical protein